MAHRRPLGLVSYDRLDLPNCRRQHTINEISIILVFIGMEEVIAEDQG